MCLYLIVITINYTKAVMSLVYFSALVLCCLIVNSQACSTIATHPQVLYCEADYVVKLLVGKERNVLLHEDGSFEYVDNHDKEPHVNEEEDKGEYTDETDEYDVDDDGDLRPEPIISDEIPTLIERPAIVTPEEVVLSEEDSELRENVDNDEPEEEIVEKAPETGREIQWPGIRISHHSRQQGQSVELTPIFTGGNIAAKSPKIEPAEVVDGEGDENNTEVQGAGPSFEGRAKRSARQRSKSRRQAASYPGNAAPGSLFIPEDISSHESSDGKGVLMRQYTVTVLKVLKGDATNGTQFLYTPPHGGLCAMSLKQRTPYLVMGKESEYGLYLSQSDYKVDLTGLNSTELRHLTSTMKHRYSKGCEDCYIRVCNRNCEAQISMKNQCIWKNMYSVVDSRAIQFACLYKKKKGICDWANTLKPHMLPSDLD